MKFKRIAKLFSSTVEYGSFEKSVFKPFGAIQIYLFNTVGLKCWEAILITCSATQWNNLFFHKTVLWEPSTSYMIIQRLSTKPLSYLSMWNSENSEKILSVSTWSSYFLTVSTLSYIIIQHFLQVFSISFLFDPDRHQEIQFRVPPYKSFKDKTVQIYCMSTFCYCFYTSIVEEAGLFFPTAVYCLFILFIFANSILI